MKRKTSRGPGPRTRPHDAYDDFPTYVEAILDGGGGGRAKRPK